MRLENKRIVITGGGGFLGSHIVEELTRSGCRDVFAPRRREYDLRSIEAIDRLFTQHRPHVLIHAAAVVGGIGANQANPGSFFYDNAIMGLQLIEAARRYRTEKVVVLGTICAYPKHTPVPFREEELWNGYPEETNAPYGLAKRMLLTQCQAYRQQFGLNSIYLLPVNLYGPRDNFDLQTSHVIPALIRKCATAAEENKPAIECWGDGSATREFLHVRDCARAIVAATEHYDQADPINIGTGHEISIRDLVNTVARFTGFKGRITWDASKPNGQPRRCLDVRRAEREFGFRATVDLEDGLRQTIDWYLAERSAMVAVR